MAPVTLVYAVLMVFLGLGCYFATEAKTALIPTFFGMAFLLLGFLALRADWRKHAMHGAALIGVIAFLAAVVSLITRGNPNKPVALVEMAVMALLSFVFVGLCVRSFVNARRARREQVTA